MKTLSSLLLLLGVFSFLSPTRSSSSPCRVEFRRNGDPPLPFPCTYGLFAPVPALGLAGTLARGGDTEGCGGPLPAAAAAGRVVLLWRGGCSFWQKARSAELGGALAVIIANNKAAGPLAMKSGGSEAAPVGIPAAMVSLSAGRQLEELAMGSGAARPAARAYLSYNASASAWAAEFLAAQRLAGPSSRHPQGVAAMVQALVAAGSVEDAVLYLRRAFREQTVTGNTEAAEELEEEPVAVEQEYSKEGEAGPWLRLRVQLVRLLLRLPRLASGDKELDEHLRHAERQTGGRTRDFSMIAVEVHFLRGQFERRQGRVDAAFHAYQRALNVNGSHVPALLNAAQAAAHAQRPEAESLLVRAIRVRPTVPALSVRLGQLLEARGDFAQAEAVYRPFLDLGSAATASPALPILEALAALRVRAGDWDEAYYILRDRVLAVQPKAIQARFNLGVVQEARGERDAAMDSYEAAAQLGSASAASNLGDLLWKQGRPDRARKALQLAIKLDPGSVGANNNFGNIVLDSGEWDLAQRHFGLALRGRLRQLDSTRACRAGWRVVKDWRQAGDGVRVSDFAISGPLAGSGAEGTYYGQEDAHSFPSAALSPYKLRFAEKQVGGREQAHRHTRAGTPQARAYTKRQRCTLHKIRTRLSHGHIYPTDDSLASDTATASFAAAPRGERYWSTIYLSNCVIPSRRRVCAHLRLCSWS